MAEYAQAVCHDRPCFHISLVQDISPNCDCHGENDAPILPDIGMFASFDPIALDQACACLLYTSSQHLLCKVQTILHIHDLFLPVSYTHLDVYKRQSLFLVPM